MPSKIRCLLFYVFRCTACFMRIFILSSISFSIQISKRRSFLFVAGKRIDILNPLNSESSDPSAPPNKEMPRRQTKTNKCFSDICHLQSPMCTCVRDCLDMCVPSCVCLTIASALYRTLAIREYIFARNVKIQQRKTEKMNRIELPPRSYGRLFLCIPRDLFGFTKKKKRRKNHDILVRVAENRRKMKWISTVIVKS